MGQVCNKCKIERDESLFYKRENGSLRKDCKTCLKEYQKSNKVYIAKKKLEWCSNNKKYLAEFSANWYINNKERANTRNNNYINSRKQIDMNFKLTRNLRSRLNTSLKKGIKSGSAVKDLGCSIEEFKTHLESLFKPGMTWDNYGSGKDKWQIDHKEPLFQFDLTNPNQLKKACNYLNLQPIWYKDHIIKTKEDIYG